MIVESVALILLLLIISRWVVQRRRFFSHLKRFNSPPGLPLIGLAWEFGDPKDTLKHLSRYVEKYGSNMFANFGLKTSLMVSEPKMVEFILSSNKFIDKSEEYDFLKGWFGEGLLTSTGNKWKSHRKILTPSFHYKILEDFVEVFDRESRILVKKMEKELEKDSFEVFEYITLCTLDIICETAMGTTVNAQEFPDSEYVRSVKAMCDVMHTRVFSVLLRYQWFYIFSSTYRTEIKALKVIHALTNSVIKQRKDALLKNHDKNEKVDEFGMRHKTTFLDTLLKCKIDGEPLSNEDIREEVDTFMFEGHDTTAVCISFTLYLLSKHSDVQQKVYDEIKEVIGEDLEKSVNYEVLQGLRYLEMVIKESLRLYPSVPGFSRHLKEDTEYDGGILPKGLDVAIVPYALHRNPDIYPEPEKFDPERFSIENSLRRHPYAFVPFSAGPRNCIGQKFAMLELKSTISKVLRCYRLLPAIPEHTVDVTSKMTIQSLNGIKMRIKRRTVV